MNKTWRERRLPTSFLSFDYLNSFHVPRSLITRDFDEVLSLLISSINYLLAPLSPEIYDVLCDVGGVPKSPHNLHQGPISPAFCDGF